MQKLFEYTIIGNPTPKGRPRFTKSGHAYTPKKTRDAEAKIKFMLQIAASVHSKLPAKNFCNVFVSFYLHRPKRLQKKTSPPEAIPHDKRPDLDNLVKLLIDASNGILFDDDAQIHQIIANKWYCEIDNEPRTYIEVWSDDE
jgi:Holliday junction resolvase RusA-like endonuclease